MKHALVFFFTTIALSYGDASHDHTPPVVLTEMGVKNLQIETAPVTKADFSVTSFALGRTEAIPSRRAFVSSRIPGRVLENRITIGQQVKKDDPLVLLESRLAGNPPPQVWLTAPAAGTILSVKAHLGSPIEPTEALAEIVDLRSLYLIVNLPQAVAGKLTRGTKANLHFPLRPNQTYEATLLQLAACSGEDPLCALGLEVAPRPLNGADTTNATAGVIFTLDNPNSDLRPGMTAECSIIREQKNQVLSVPRQAIQGSPEDRHVYLKHPTIEHAFVRVPVQTGLSNEQRTEILAGLDENDIVVTRGSYSLDFAGGSNTSLKEALDAAHGHEHNEDGSEKTSNPEEHDHEHADEHADEHDHEHAEEHDHEHDHAEEQQHTDEHEHEHASSSPSTREKFLMIATGLLSLLLIVQSLKGLKRHSSQNQPS